MKKKRLWKLKKQNYLSFKLPLELMHDWSHGSNMIMEMLRLEKGVFKELCFYFKKKDFIIIWDFKAVSFWNEYFNDYRFFIRRSIAKKSINFGYYVTNVSLHLVEISEYDELFEEIYGLFQKENHST